MTGIAVIGAQYVVRRLGHGADRRTDSVACRALMRRTFEDGVDVTRFAGQVAMLAGQFKTGCKMIELRTLLRRITGRYYCEHQRHGCDSAQNARSHSTAGDPNMHARAHDDQAVATRRAVGIPAWRRKVWQLGQLLES